MSEELPPGSILARDFTIGEVPPDASLFFDDYDVNIRDVQEHVNEKRLNLHSVFCPPGPIAWHDANGMPFNSVADYRFLKSLDDVSFSHDFRRFIKKDKIEVGNGLTPGMIRQIIEYDKSPIARAHNRVYFFDFDMVLNQLSGLDFSFLGIQTDNEDSLLNQYAKYIFSDHIGPEPAGGRLTLLQTMFRTIGPERIYIITSNGFANIHSSYLQSFIKILKILLPEFNPNHLVCTNSKNQPPLYNKKSAAIIDILTKRAETMRKPKSVKPQSVKSVIAKPKSVKPKSAIVPQSLRVLRSSAITRNGKGGSKRRMRVRCTRRKRRITG
jgi:hypothetical protein